MTKNWCIAKELFSIHLGPESQSFLEKSRSSKFRRMHEDKQTHRPMIRCTSTCIYSFQKAKHEYLTILRVSREELTSENVRNPSSIGLYPVHLQRLPEGKETDGHWTTCVQYQRNFSCYRKLLAMFTAIFSAIFSTIFRIVSIKMNISIRRMEDQFPKWQKEAFI